MLFSVVLFSIAAHAAPFNPSADLAQRFEAAQLPQADQVVGLYAGLCYPDIKNKPYASGSAFLTVGQREVRGVKDTKFAARFWSTTDLYNERAPMHSEFRPSVVYDAAQDMLTGTSYGVAREEYGSLVSEFIKNSDRIDEANYENVKWEMRRDDDGIYVRRTVLMNNVVGYCYFYKKFDYTPSPGRSGN